VNQYIEASNKWEESYRVDDYPGAMMHFELRLAFLPPFIDHGKASSRFQSFKATSIRGLEETAFPCARDSALLADTLYAVMETYRRDGAGDPAPMPS
jgi:hypothetical protein